MKKFVLLSSFFVLVCLAIYLNFPNKDTKSVSTFEECTKAGNPIQESYPARCITKDGKSFTQDIGNELELTDQIQLLQPRPSETVERTFLVSGKARGTWYFEGIMSYELVDSSGVILAQGSLQASSDWMTEEFVPFEATVNFDVPEALSGKLIIKKANPSDMPERDDALVVPLNFILR